MGKQVVLEVTHPFHANGREVLYQPGHQLPLDADLPDGLVVREVIADVPDAPAKATVEGKAAVKAAPAKGA